MLKLIAGAVRVLLYVVGIIGLLWAAGALRYDLPAPLVVRKIAAGLLLLGVVLLWVFGKFRGRAASVLLLGVVAGWWFTLKPSNDGDWQPDVAQLAWADVSGDEVTFHNVRNCVYRTESDYTPVWETRKVNMSKLTGIDIAICYWGSPSMAHPIVSFQFADALPVCFSIETRKNVGEQYSAIGGIYRQYELIYTVADERDVMRVRTNFRKGEDLYLYRLKMAPDKTRERFMDYVNALNYLRDNPRWYNAVTTNCTTSIRTQHAANERARWDWRMLVNGYMDEMMFERGVLLTEGKSFAELKKAAHINERAHAAGDSPEFSARIRFGMFPK